MKNKNNLIERFDNLNVWQTSIILFVLAGVGFIIITFIVLGIVNVYHQHTQILEGVIVDMKHSPAHYESIGTIKMNNTIRIPEKWKVRISNEYRTNTYSISQDLYNKLKVGDKVIVTDEYRRI
jgi:hypothetical protein